MCTHAVSGCLFCALLRLFVFFLGGGFFQGEEAVADVLVQQVAFFPEEGFKFGERVDFLNHFGKAGMEDGGDFFAGCFVVHAFAQGDVFGGEVVVELDFGVVVDFKLSNHGEFPLGWLG